jgi:hypothetical protein
VLFVAVFGAWVLGLIAGGFVNVGQYAHTAKTANATTSSAGRRYIRSGRFADR